MMKASAIAYERLKHLQLTQHPSKTVPQLVRSLCALQAQDFGMARWAVGARLPGVLEKQVLQAYNKGQILRAHVLRPTWHFIAAEDIYWLLAVSAERIKMRMRSNDRLLELNEKIFAKSTAAIEKLLQAGRHYTREEIADQLLKYKIRCDENRLSHILMRAELEAVVCSGPMQQNKLTYTLLKKRVPRSKELDMNTALALLATRYFSSRGPATLQDFSWWSGLAIGLARQALESVKSKLLSEKTGGAEYWFADTATTAHPTKKSVLLLPAFDEFIVSYTDRSATLARHHLAKVLTKNGIFYPAILIDGQTVGIWKRKLASSHLIVEANLFKPVIRPVKKKLEDAAAALGHYLGAVSTEVTYLKGR